MYSEVPKLFARPGFQISLTIPDVIFASTPEHEPVKMRTTIRVAKFFASACGMMKMMSTAYIAWSHSQHMSMSPCQSTRLEDKARGLTM